MTSFVVFHQDGRVAAGPGNTTFTTGTVREFPTNPDWIVVVHDLKVVNLGSECSAAYVIEFADDPAALDSK